MSIVYNYRLVFGNEIDTQRSVYILIQLSKEGAPSHTAVVAQCGYWRLTFSAVNRQINIVAYQFRVSLPLCCPFYSGKVWNSTSLSAVVSASSWAWTINSALPLQSREPFVDIILTYCTMSSTFYLLRTARRCAIIRLTFAWNPWKKITLSTAVHKCRW